MHGLRVVGFSHWWYVAAMKEAVMTGATVRKTYKYKLQPTPAQEQALERVLWRCRTLYNAALEERQTAWQRRQVSVTYSQQKAELPAVKTGCPEYTEVHSQVLQDVLLRLDRAFQAFFRRRQEGQNAGYPRFRGRTRSTSFTYPQFDNGATLDKDVLVLSKIGQLRMRWSRPLEGTPKTVTVSREADGWYVGFSCAEVPLQLLPATGQETGIDLGLESFAPLADGSQIANPRIFRVAELNLKRAQRRVSRQRQ
jgi:putative transposase